MPIYSQTRTGTSGTGMVEEAKGYFNAAGIGRIMYENEINDMRLFEAAIGRDFAEAQGLREGTILESELSAMQEASAKEFFNTLKEKVKSFWKKIKGIFATAINQVAAFVVRDGRAFVKLNRSKLLKGNFSKVKLGDEGVAILAPEKLAEITGKMTSAVNAVSKDVAVGHNKDEAISDDTFYSSLQDGWTKENFAENFKKYCTKEGIGKNGMNGAIVKDMINQLENGKDLVGALKKAQKNADDALKKVLGEIDELEKKSKSAAKADKEGKTEAVSYSMASSYVSKCQSFVAVVSKASIKLVKQSMSKCRHALARCLAYQEATLISDDRAFCEGFAYSEAKCAECDCADSLDAEVEDDFTSELED